MRLTGVCGCFQYPLKEVVVIHQDAEALADIQSLQKYILEVSVCVARVSQSQHMLPVI